MAAARPKPGNDETRAAPDLQLDDRRIRGLIPYSVESRDLGGFNEIIEPGAFDSTKFDNLVATVDHAGVPLGRHPTTLELEDRSDGLHWSIDPPESRADIREAVTRGDLKGASWRMVVGRDEWRGNTRHVHEIAVLRDVSIVTRPTYDEATVEFRSQPDPAAGQEDIMAEQAEPQNTPEPVEETRNHAGSLRVEERAELPRFQSLTEAFRSRGFPGDVAVLDFDEYRTLTYTGGSVDANAPTRVAGSFGADVRYAWQAVPTVSVGSEVTSVDVFSQTARTLPAGTAVLRAIDSVAAKPEVSQTATIANTQLKQIAVISTNIPNIYLERQEVSQIIEGDLRLGFNEGLDSTVLTGLGTSGFQGADVPTANLTSIRAAMTTIWGNGYVPDTLIQTPASAQALDLLVTGLTGGTADYSWGAGQFASGVFGLRTVVSKSAAAPVVLDSTANGKLYLGPVTLARFEVDAGSTNRSNVRLESNGVYGVERTGAAVRIAAS